MTTSIQVPAFNLPLWDGLVCRPDDWTRNTEDGKTSEYTLFRDTPLNPEEQAIIGLFELREADFWVQGQVDLKRLKTASGLAGQRHAERIQFGPSGLPREWKNFFPLIFAGTIWLRVSDQTFWVPGLSYFNDLDRGWHFDFYRVDSSPLSLPTVRLVRTLG